MTTPATPAKRPGRRWYGLAAALAVISLTIGVLLAVWIGRALVGYDIETFPPDTQVSVVLKDRGEAVWVSPDNAVASCRAIDSNQQDSLDRASATSVTTTDGGRSWGRLGIIKGAPGSTHTLTCSSGSGDEVFGHAPNPQIARYVTGGLIGGGISGLSALAALVIVVVVAIKRNRRPNPTPGPA